MDAWLVQCEPNKYCEPQSRDKSRERKKSKRATLQSAPRTVNAFPDEERPKGAFEAAAMAPTLAAAAAAAAADGLGHVAESLGAQAEDWGAPSPRFTSKAPRPDPLAPPPPAPVEVDVGSNKEVERLTALLEEQRLKNYDQTRRVMELLEQLRDEQERADDFRSQLEMRDVDVIRLERRIEERQQVRKQSRPDIAELEPSLGRKILGMREDGCIPTPPPEPADKWSRELQEEEEAVQPEEEVIIYRGDRRSRTLRSSLENVTGVAYPTENKTHALNDQDLISCFRGIVPPTEDSGISRGSAPRGEGHEDQYSWILALSLPNPRDPVNQALRSHGISHHEAASIFDRCFKAEEVGGDKDVQKERHLQEKELFMNAFNHLPSAEGNPKLKRFAGIEPAASVFWMQLEEMGMSKDTDQEQIAHSFLELLRNTIVTKITMHCQLPVRTCATEDARSVLVLVTATPKDLLWEADRQGFPTELDVRMVDPASLEPCCPKSFYPLLDWYLRKAPYAPVQEVADAYAKVILSLMDADEEDLSRRSLEVAFWAKHEAKPEEVVLKESASGDVGKDGQPQTVEQVMKLAMHEKDHLYHSARKRAALQRAFVKYLELKAERGLNADPLELQDEANKFVGSKVLVNWHNAIGLEGVAYPYKAFRVEQYSGKQARPWEWKAYQCRARRADVVISTPFNGNERAKLLESIILRQLDLAQLTNLGLINSVFPLDGRDKIESTIPGHLGEPSLLHERWGMIDGSNIIRKVMHFIQGIFHPVPLEEAKDYYGERIAFYFALVELICWWLIIPGLTGIAVMTAHKLMPYDPRVEKAPRLRVGLDLMYATLIAVWSTVLQERWKRRQIGLALLWGQRGINKVEEPRPRFFGIQRRSPVTYEDGELHYPTRERLKSQILSLCVLCGLAGLEYQGTIYTGKLRGAWIENDWPFHERAQQGTALLEDLQMTVCSKLGYFLAWKLNERENLRTGTEYINGLIAKVVAHELWNRFHLYFYVAFLKANREGCVITDAEGTQNLVPPEEMYGRMCQEEVSTQVTMVLCVEFAKNALELIKPLVKTHFSNWFRPAPEVIAVDEARGVARMAHFCQDSMEKPEYGASLEVDGTFGDYLELMILLGHFTLFPLVFPLAPTMGFILLLVELRVDGFKLFELVRRPLPRSAEDIGNWFYVIMAISWTSMFTNVGLVVFTLGAFDEYFGDLPRWVYFVFLAGVLSLFKVFLQIVVPDVPHCVTIAEEHSDHVRAQIDKTYAEDVPHVQEKVHLAALDLTVDDANTGQWRDPAEFGISTTRIRKRLQAIRKRRKKKAHAAAAAAFVAGAGSGAAAANTVV